jgi:hypothetical protein
MKTPDFLGKTLTLLLPAILFVAVEASAQSCDPCFICPCNQTFYASPQTCVKNCNVTLRCFVGICRPCKKCEFYEDARNQLLDGMIFLRAYCAGNRVLLNWLLKNSGCENTPQGKQQLNDQQALLNSLCK